MNYLDLIMIPVVFQVMVTNVTSLLKTVKAVEDEHARGTRALESTIEAIAQEIRVTNISLVKWWMPIFGGGVKMINSRI